MTASALATTTPSGSPPSIHEAPDPFAPPCKTGDVVSGKYRVESLLGCGGMAWVFEATHVALGACVALKVLRTNPDGDNAEAIVRFQREAQAASRISSDATARVLDVGELEGGAPFMVMERLEGSDLEALIEGHEDEMHLATAVDYVLQACEGLAEAHAAGIVHRDIKPSNLFLTRAADGTLRVKLIDFGISRFSATLTGAGEVTQTRALIGSPTYMSPEQMRSSRRVDGRTDIWAMGVVLYSLLTRGRSPFEAQTLPEICAHVMDGEPRPLRSLRRDVPRKLERVVLRCLEKEPTRRFQTVAELAAALVSFGPEGSDARSARIARIVGGARTPLVRSCARLRWRQLCVAVAAGMALGAGAWATRTVPSFAASAVSGAACSPPPASASEVPEMVVTRATASSASAGSVTSTTASTSATTTSTSSMAGTRVATARPRAATSGASPPTPKVLALAPDDEVDIPEFGSRE